MFTDLDVRMAAHGLGERGLAGGSRHVFAVHDAPLGVASLSREVEAAGLAAPVAARDRAEGAAIARVAHEEARVASGMRQPMQGSAGTAAIIIPAAAATQRREAARGVACRRARHVRLRHPFD